MTIPLADRIAALAGYLRCAEDLRHADLVRAELREALSGTEIDAHIARDLLQLAEAEFLDALDPWFASGGAGADPMRLLSLRQVPPARRAEALAFIRRNSRMPAGSIIRTALDAAVVTADRDFLAHVLDLAPALHPGRDTLSRERLANGALGPGPCWVEIFSRIPLDASETDRFAQDLLATQSGRGIALLLARGYDFRRLVRGTASPEGQDWIARLTARLSSAHGRLGLVSRLPRPEAIAEADERVIRVLLAGTSPRIARLAAAGPGPERDLVAAAESLAAAGSR